MTNAQPVGEDRYEFDLADRMRRALRVSGVGVTEMAEYLEVNRDTVGNWINGRARPRTRDARLFAMKTGFSLVWLTSGQLPEEDSNFQPAGIKSGPWLALVERAEPVSGGRDAEVVELRQYRERPRVILPQLA